ncbi:MAG: 50S ribosomal protein L3 [archaeon]
MAKKSKPRAGSMAFYPRVRAKSIIPKFSSFIDLKTADSKPLAFYAIKSKMTHIHAKNMHKNSSTYGQEVSYPVTIVESPDMKVIGARFYKLNSSVLGKSTIYEYVLRDNMVSKKIKGNLKSKKENKAKDANLWEKKKDLADSLVLICYVNYKATYAGQKKPVIVEIPLSGTYANQILYFKEKLGKTISVDEVFNKDDYLDVKSITIGHGTEGPVTRFGVKIQRPKAQQAERHVGSVGPWHPATIMYTVARAGQHGFHNRTTFNKRILMMDSDFSKINPTGGFRSCGPIKNKYLLVYGVLPGPSKRVLALRKAVRPQRNSVEITDISYIYKKN